MIAATLLAAVALAAPSAEPLPDHPTTGKPVQPTWTYTWDTTTADKLWRVRCVVPVEGRRVCWLLGPARRNP